MTFYRFHPRAFVTLVLLDAAGGALAFAGILAGSPAAFLAGVTVSASAVPAAVAYKRRVRRGAAPA